MKHKFNVSSLLPTKSEAVGFIKQTTLCTAAVLLTISYGPRDPYVAANSPTGTSNLSLMTVFNPVELGDSSLIRASADNISVVLNGTKITFNDASPQIVNDRTLVPLRGVFEEMGYLVDWDAEAWSTTEPMPTYGTNDPTIIKISSGSNIINRTIYISKRNVITNSEGTTLETDVPPQMINERYYLPLRVIAEATGATVDWDDATKTVSINFDIVSLGTPPTLEQMGEGYEGQFGDYADIDWSTRDYPGLRESINLQNYNHKIYYEGAPADNPHGLPEGAYFVSSDNVTTLTGEAVSLDMGGVTTMDGYTLYLGESRESIEAKIGSPNSSYSAGEELVYKYNDIGGVQISYTESGRAKDIIIISGKSNNYLNEGFTYGNSYVVLGNKATGAGTPLATGEMPVSRNYTLDTFFGTNTCMQYQFRPAGDDWTAMSLNIALISDQYADPF